MAKRKYLRVPPEYRSFLILFGLIVGSSALAGELLTFAAIAGSGIRSVKSGLRASFREADEDIRKMRFPAHQ
jgi:hypothetical protein